MTCALLVVGGVPALQSASVVSGLPLAGVTVLMGVGIVRDLLARRL